MQNFFLFLGIAVSVVLVAGLLIGVGMRALELIGVIKPVKDPHLDKL